MTAEGNPMRITLAQDRREDLLAETRRYFREEFDRELSAFQAERLLDFFVDRLGVPVYNQAIHDVRASLQAKLDDLEGEFGR